MRPRKTPYSKDRSAENNVVKYKPRMRFTCGKRNHWNDSCPESKKSMISTCLSSFNAELNLDQSQINMTRI
jgi:hypothetical protein